MVIDNEQIVDRKFGKDIERPAHVRRSGPWEEREGSEFR
jgi:hypothetical protein